MGRLPSPAGALPPAIVVSGSTMGLGVIRSLGRRGVPLVVLTYDPSDMAHRSRYPDEWIRCPHPEDEPEAFLHFLLGLSTRFAGSVLIPASDAALAAVSRAHEDLGSHYVVACQGWDATRLILQKEHTYPLAEAAGVSVPQTLVPSGLDQARQFARSLGFPLLVKPSQGHLFTARFGEKMVEVADERELVEVAGPALAAGLRILLQEVVPGPDCAGANYNAFSIEGVPLVEFTARKIRSAPPRYGSPSALVSCRIEEVAEEGRKLLKALEFTGFSCSEFKQDERSGIYRLMEVNGRHNLSSLLAVECGIDFPWIHYRYLSAGEIPEVSSFEEGVHWVDILRDMAHHFRGEYRAGLGQLLAPHLGRHVHAVLDWRDPLPFLVHAAKAVWRRSTS